MVQTAVTQVVKTLNDVHERFGLRRSPSFNSSALPFGIASQLAGLHQIERPNFPFERPVQPSTLDWKTMAKQFSRPPEIAQPLYSHCCLALVPK
jgi:hypothetical protein